MSALQLFCQSRFKLQLVKLGLVFLPLAAALFFVCLWWFFLFFLYCSRLGLFACGVGVFWGSFACAALSCLVAYGVGLSLNCYWFINVAPVRGRHLLFFACCKEK
ncbi:hypothetical protein PQQ63_25050 [Paraburkholderia metrosideri]|uniref:Uncharacterized protein n=1 Tax=Paraburkholderia metrosideri TaxID=580937 RepID=A0ABW9DZ73_9BURK